MEIVTTAMAQGYAHNFDGMDAEHHLIKAAENPRLYHVADRYKIRGL